MTQSIGAFQSALDGEAVLRADFSGIAAILPGTVESLIQ